MRGAVQKKRKSEKRGSRPSSAKNRQKSGTDNSATKTENTEEQEKGKAPKKRPASLRVAARRVKQAIPDIVDRMVEEAKKGNVQHLKTVLQCTGVDKLLEQECQPKKQKSLAELLIRRLETQNETEESVGNRTESE